ncbi:hypothetical protein ACFPOI_16195 [Nonomuraea angiospora]|uniref:Uncharacterized protein n=1 Tax=Nonomuraea angiospora TaxID=46172 RepID=A0ABR9MGX4_9ACTN|nr:hypothetical protein [Nonomuraea angiospora]MBE1592174.1 hypothetical protein [Nonomuraea angiospora]
MACPYRPQIAAGAPGRLRALVEHERERIEELLGHPGGDEDLVERARRHLGGDPRVEAGGPVLAMVSATAAMAWVPAVRPSGAISW